MWTKRTRISFLAVCGVLAVLPTSRASIITFTTPSGSTQGGQPVNAKAVFNISPGQVIIDLSNLLTAAQMVTVAQDLSDLSFSLSGTFASGLVSDANRTYSGTLINVASDGSVSSGSGSFNGWDFSNSGSTFLLEDLNSAVGPAQTIIGGTAGSTTAYSNANGSIAGNNPHNPFLQGTAHFILNIAGVTANTTVTGVVFSFGTTLGNNVDGGGGTIQSTPEPATLALMGLGLFGLGTLGRRLRQPK